MKFKREIRPVMWPESCLTLMTRAPLGLALHTRWPTPKVQDIVGGGSCSGSWALPLLPGQPPGPDWLLSPLRPSPSPRAGEQVVSSIILGSLRSRTLLLHLIHVLLQSRRPAEPGSPRSDWSLSYCTALSEPPLVHSDNVGGKRSTSYITQVTGLHLVTTHEAESPD